MGGWGRGWGCRGRGAFPEFNSQFFDRLVEAVIGLAEYFDYGIQLFGEGGGDFFEGFTLGGGDGDAGFMGRPFGADGFRHWALSRWWLGGREGGLEEGWKPRA